MKLYSPVSGRALTQHGHTLVADDERWPVVAGIPYLRADRRMLADQALALLDSNDATGALVLLLGDQDDWARTPPPEEAARLRLIEQRETLTFRAAMDLLAFGAVGTYFAHRWSDPTFLSGLALAQSCQLPARVFELACGTGHFLRAFGKAASGGDVVFAKLWLARHFVAPHADLVCFNAASAWPIGAAADAVFCHDAFYFLPEKACVAASMMRAAPRVLIGHMHNGLVGNYSSGSPLAPAEYASLFPDCILFDDRELTQALLQSRAPVTRTPQELQTASAIALAWPSLRPVSACGPLAEARDGARLQRNPLYIDGRIAWPTPQYEAEYAGLVTYPDFCDAPEHAVAGESALVDNLAHRRVLLDLPERW